MSELENKRQELGTAIEALNALKDRAARYPKSAMPATLEIDIADKQKQVEKLRAEIAKLEVPECPSLEPPHLPQRVPFTNRQDEMELILSSYAPAYYLLDAPAGYGKTELLKTLKQHFDERNWVCAYVCIDDNGSFPGLATALAQELDLTQLLAQDIGLPLSLLLSGAMQKKWEGEWESIPKEKEGVALLIDLDKRPSLLIVRELLEELIPAIQDSLRTLEFFANKHNRFRVILAGRHLAANPEIQAAPLRLSFLSLSPFDYDVIRSSAREYLVGQDERAIRQLSAHLFYLTGGHPGCIAQIMEMYRETGVKPDAFLEHCGKTIWSDIVRKVVEDVRDGIPKGSRDLHKVLDRLSVFRYLDYAILKHMIIDREIAKINSEHDLADELTATYLLEWKGRLLQDDITRRLLAIRLWHEMPEEFSRRCVHAREICADHMQQPNVQMPEMWIIEYLFQSLQQYAANVQDPAKREDIRRNFFQEDVPDALKTFVDDRNITLENRRGEQNALKQALKGDWEFRFTVNYYLRLDQYDEEPYKDLQRHIDSFFSE